MESSSFAVNCTVRSNEDPIEENEFRLRSVGEWSERNSAARTGGSWPVRKQIQNRLRWAAYVRKLEAFLRPHP
jgi:hypothetical protein